MSLAHSLLSPSPRRASAAPSSAVRRLLGAAAATALAIAGSLVALAAPAAAQSAVTDTGAAVHGVLVPALDGPIIEPQSFSQCLAGNVCVWDGYSYTGLFSQTPSTSATSTGITTAHSYANRSTKAARIYSGTGGSGSWICVNPGAQVSSTTIGAQSMRILTVTSC